MTIGKKFVLVYSIFFGEPSTSREDYRLCIIDIDNDSCLLLTTPHTIFLLS